MELKIQDRLGVLVEEECVVLKQPPRPQEPFVVDHTLFVVEMFIFVYELKWLFRFRLKIEN